MKAKEIVDLAKKEVGYLEKSKMDYIHNPSCIWYKIDGHGTDNITKYAYKIDRTIWYNEMPKQGFPWCAVFVDYLFLECCNWDLKQAAAIKYHGIYDAVVDYAIDNYRANGAWYTEPEIGDQIFFCDSNGDPCHTGLVVDVDDTYVHTIEGNTSGDEFNANGGGVFAKKYKKNYWRIYGYGRPQYEREDDTMTKDEILKELGDQYIHTYEELPKWAKPYVRYMLDHGIINGGTDYDVNPDDINMFLSDIKNLICTMRLLGIKVDE